MIKTDFLLTKGDMKMGWVSKEDEKRFEERMEQRMIDEHERIFGWNYIEKEQNREIGILEDMMESDFEEGLQEMAKHRRDHEGE